MLDDVPADPLEQIRIALTLGRHYQGQCISPTGGGVFTLRRS